MHQALYRKWRPQTFDQVCGQEHITDILKYETSQGKISHAYLFCGSRGTGKTTCAKILARAVNCEHPVNGNPCGECYACRSILDGSCTDVLEMDAASNNKVDDVRAILDEVIYTPGMLKYRVYIIDEVHMLTTPAFNALLKTLEEPPEHVIFILATTEMQKLPATIISRCQRFDFRRIASKVLVERLKYIASEEKITLDGDAALIIARLAQGGMRDAISLFELCSAGGRAVTAETVAQTVGFRGRGPMSSFVRLIAKSDYPALFEAIAATEASASDIGVFWQELISYYRDMMVFRTAGEQTAVRYLDLTDEETAALSYDSSLFPPEILAYHASLLDGAYASMQRQGISRRTVAELTVMRMCNEKLSSSPEALLARIAALEAKAASGNLTVTNAREENGSVRDEAAVREGKKADPRTSAGGGKSASHAAETSGKPDKKQENVKNRLTPMSGWAETVEEFSRDNQGAAAMLSSEKAYTDGSGRIIIKYTKEVTKMLVSRPAALNSLCAAASVATGKTVSPSDIVFEKAGPGAEEDSAAADLVRELGSLADGN